MNSSNIFSDLFTWLMQTRPQWTLFGPAILMEIPLIALYVIGWARHGQIPFVLLTVGAVLVVLHHLLCIHYFAAWMYQQGEGVPWFIEHSPLTYLGWCSQIVGLWLLVFHTRILRKDP